MSMQADTGGRGTSKQGPPPELATFHVTQFFESAEYSTSHGTLTKDPKALRETPLSTFGVTHRHVVPLWCLQQVPAIVTAIKRLSIAGAQRHTAPETGVDSGDGAVQQGSRHFTAIEHRPPRFLRCATLSVAASASAHVGDSDVNASPQLNGCQPPSSLELPPLSDLCRVQRANFVRPRLPCRHSRAKRHDTQSGDFAFARSIAAQDNLGQIFFCGEGGEEHGKSPSECTNPYVWRNGTSVTPEDRQRYGACPPPSSSSQRRPFDADLSQLQLSSPVFSLQHFPRQASTENALSLMTSTALANGVSNRAYESANRNEAKSSVTTHPSMGVNQSDHLGEPSAAPRHSAPPLSCLLLDEDLVSMSLPASTPSSVSTNASSIKPPQQDSSSSAKVLLLHEAQTANPHFSKSVGRTDNQLKDSSSAPKAPTEQPKAGSPMSSGLEVTVTHRYDRYTSFDGNCLLLVILFPLWMSQQRRFVDGDIQSVAHPYPPSQSQVNWDGQKNQIKQDTPSESIPSNASHYNTRGMGDDAQSFSDGSSEDVSPPYAALCPNDPHNRQLNFTTAEVIAYILEFLGLNENCSCLASNQSVPLDNRRNRGRRSSSGTNDGQPPRGLAFWRRYPTLSRRTVEADSQGLGGLSPTASSSGITFAQARSQTLSISRHNHGAEGPCDGKLQAPWISAENVKGSQRFESICVGMLVVSALLGQFSLSNRLRDICLSFPFQSPFALIPLVAASVKLGDVDLMLRCYHALRSLTMSEDGYLATLRTQMALAPLMGGREFSEGEMVVLQSAFPTSSELLKALADLELPAGCFAAVWPIDLRARLPVYSAPQGYTLCRLERRRSLSPTAKLHLLNSSDHRYPLLGATTASSTSTSRLDFPHVYTLIEIHSNRPLLVAVKKTETGSADIFYYERWSRPWWQRSAVIDEMSAVLKSSPASKSGVTTLAKRANDSDKETPLRSDLAGCRSNCHCLLGIHNMTNFESGGRHGEKSAVLATEQGVGYDQQLGFTDNDVARTADPTSGPDRNRSWYGPLSAFLHPPVTRCKSISHTDGRLHSDAQECLCCAVASTVNIEDDPLGEFVGTASLVGRIKTNFWGTKFKLFDNGIPINGWGGRAAEVNAALTHLGLAGFQSTLIGRVEFETNILGEAPRKMRGFFKSASKYGAAVDAGSRRHTNVAKSTAAGGGTQQISGTEEDSNGDSLCEFENLDPVWDARIFSYALPFYGRVTKASAKNLQLVSKTNRADILLMFGKISKDVFSLDFRCPLTPIDAMAVAVAALSRKRAVS